MEDGDIDILDHVEHGVKVVAKVSLDNGARSENIKVIFAPSVVTLLGEVEKMFQRIQTCGRILMLQKLADIYVESGMDGIFGEYERSTTACATITTFDGSISVILRTEVGFGAINAAKHQKAVENAKNTFIYQLLSDFSVLGGR